MEPREKIGGKDKACEELTKVGLSHMAVVTGSPQNDSQPHPDFRGKKRDLLNPCCHLPTQRVPRTRMTTTRTSLDVFGERSSLTSGRIPPNLTISF